MKATYAIMVLKLGSDFVFDNLNSTVGLMVLYLHSVKNYMQWLMIHFIVATPNFKIIELKTTVIYEYNIFKKP